MIEVRQANLLHQVHLKCWVSTLILKMQMKVFNFSYSTQLSKILKIISTKLMASSPQFIIFTELLLNYFDGLCFLRTTTQL
jgi:hypothetical protein